MNGTDVIDVLAPCPLPSLPWRLSRDPGNHVDAVGRPLNRPYAPGSVGVPPRRKQKQAATFGGMEELLCVGKGKPDCWALNWICISLSPRYLPTASAVRVEQSIRYVCLFFKKITPELYITLDLDIGCCFILTLSRSS